MSEIRRYDLDLSDYQGYMKKCDDGEFVLFEDYEKLKAENEELKASVKYWEDKKIDIAQCCLENELEAKKLRKKCEVLSEALKETLGIVDGFDTKVERICKKALAEAESIK
jgi:cell division septum initiation protein DivIVA